MKRLRTTICKSETPPRSGKSKAPGTRNAIAALMPVALLGPLAALPAQAQTNRVVVVPPTRSRTLTLSFYNAEVIDVLRAVSLQSGVNIAVTPSLRGKTVTVRLVGVTFDEALRLITEAAGVTYRKIGNAYLVGTAAEMKRGGATGATSTYVLRNLRPADARTLIEAALPYVSVQFVEGVPAIILSGVEGDILQAQRLLEIADVATPTTEILTATNVSPEFLRDILTRASPGVTVDVRGNTLILAGPRDAVERARAQAATVDVPSAANRRVELYNIRYSSAQSLREMLTQAIPGLQVTAAAEAYAPGAAQFQPLTGASFGSGSYSGLNGGYGTSNMGGIGNIGLASGGAGIISATPAGLGASGAAAGSPSGSTTKSRALIIAGRDTDVTQALSLLQTLDVAPQQIEIEARVVDLSLNNTFDFGIQWGTSQTQTGTGTGGGTTQDVFVQGTSGPDAIRERRPPEVIRFGRFDRDPLRLALQLQYLETRGISKTLANPRISVIDNEGANIFIGDILRFQTLALASATAGQSFTVQEVPVGIALLVRPRVNDNREITMNVHPVVSTLTGQVQGLPQTASREADTTLRVRDGETIVIGGLIRDQEVKSVQEVPLLSRIPIIGELFRNRSNSRRRSEVLIFLTPRLLRDNGAAAAVQQQQQITPQLPGSRR